MQVSILEGVKASVQRMAGWRCPSANQLAALRSRQDAIFRLAKMGSFQTIPRRTDVVGTFPNENEDAITRLIGALHSNRTTVRFSAADT